MLPVIINNLNYFSNFLFITTFGNDHFHNLASTLAATIYTLLIQKMYIDDTLPTGYLYRMIRGEKVDDVMIPGTVLSVVKIQMQLTVVNSEECIPAILLQHLDDVLGRFQGLLDKLCYLFF